MTELEIFSDVACPWCFIGSRRLARTLAARPSGDVHVRWRAFELQPGLPREGVPAETFFPRKFGGEDRMREAYAQVAAVGAAEGIAFDFAALRRAPNTLLAHQLVALARRRGRETEAVDALFSGYFEQGADIADLEVLLGLAAAPQVGLDPEELRGPLARDEALDEVRADLAEAAALGITSVPTFVADRRYAVSGAQPPALLGQLLDAVDAPAGSLP